MYIYNYITYIYSYTLICDVKRGQGFGKFYFLNPLKSFAFTVAGSQEY